MIKDPKTLKTAINESGGFMHGVSEHMTVNYTGTQSFIKSQ